MPFAKSVATILAGILGGVAANLFTKHLEQIGRIPGGLRRLFVGLAIFICLLAAVLAYPTEAPKLIRAETGDLPAPSTAVRVEPPSPGTPVLVTNSYANDPEEVARRYLLAQLARDVVTMRALFAPGLDLPVVNSLSPKRFDRVTRTQSSVSERLAQVEYTYLVDYGDGVWRPGKQNHKLRQADHWGWQVYATDTKLDLSLIQTEQVPFNPMTVAYRWLDARLRHDPQGMKQYAVPGFFDAYPDSPPLPLAKPITVTAWTLGEYENTVDFAFAQVRGQETADYLGTVRLRKQADDRWLVYSVEWRSP